AGKRAAHLPSDRESQLERIGWCRVPAVREQHARPVRLAGVRNQRSLPAVRWHELLARCCPTDFEFSCAGGTRLCIDNYFRRRAATPVSARLPWAECWLPERRLLQHGQLRQCK